MDERHDLSMTACIASTLAASMAVSDAWHAKGVAAYYGYVGNDAGSRYNYAGLSTAACRRSPPDPARSTCRTDLNAG